MDARVTYTEPRNGQYVLELELTGHSSETILICPAQQGKSDADMTSFYSRVRGVLGGLDFFADSALPKMHIDDELYGIAKVLEYIRDSVVDGSLMRIAGKAMTKDLRRSLLECDDLLKNYRKDGAGPVFGHQREMREANPVSAVEKSSLERLCIRKF